METKTDYKFHLDKSSRKFKCPQCGKKTFVKYLDAEGQYQSDEYGRCDREVNCGYILYPNSEEGASAKTYSAPVPKTKVYFPQDVFEQTLKDYDVNVFLNNLLRLGIPEAAVKTAVDEYKLGTISKGKYSGAVTFPYLDKFRRVHSIQVKVFGSDNKTLDQNWLHSILYYHYKPSGLIPKWLTDYYNNEKKTECLFGEHLIEEYPSKDIIITESPKNAILGSFILPEYVWMASGSLRSLSVNKLRKLKGRNVLLIPDTSKNNVAFSEWEAVCEGANSSGIKVRMFSFLEDITSDEQKAAGYDIADYISDLLQDNPNLFKKSVQVEPLPARRIVSEDSLWQLASEILQECESKTESELIAAIEKADANNGGNPKDLIIEMRLKNIIDMTVLGSYFLFNSTPF